VSETQKASCPVCQRRIYVRKDGSIGPHRAAWSSEACAGSNAVVSTMSETTVSCAVCGSPTKKERGICSRTQECRIAYRNSLKIGCEPPPCTVCGKPTASKRGICSRTPECRHAYMHAYNARIGCEPPPKGSQRTVQICQLRSQVLSLAEIGKVYGVSRERIRRDGC
jgi:hypothetical protein